jgi:hypothetical protein
MGFFGFIAPCLRQAASDRAIANLQFRPQPMSGNFSPDGTAGFNEVGCPGFVWNWLWEKELGWIPMFR